MSITIYLENGTTTGSWSSLNKKRLVDWLCSINSSSMEYSLKKVSLL